MTATSRLMLLAFALSALTAYEAEAQAPQVCSDESEFRQFDFWVGEWEVFNNPNGNRVGTNRIEALHGGCLLLEHWEAANGDRGTSMNYYDSVSGLWRQVWVASNYSIDIRGGLTESDEMVLEGEIHNYRLRQGIPFRGTWTPLPDGDVRQLFEQQDPDTGEWQVWFDGRYKPMREPRPGER